MPHVKFQTDAQHARFQAMSAELLYAKRVAADIAQPLIERRDEILKQLHRSCVDIGMPQGVQQFVVKPDGLYFAGPGQVWDAEKEAFVDPQKAEATKPAKKATKRRTRG